MENIFLNGDPMSESVCTSALALIALVDDTAAVVEAMGPALFTSLAPCHSATIGMHLRHSADHMRALVRGAAAGTVEYDARQAGSIEEQDLGAAITRLKALAEDLRAFRAGCERTAVRVTVYMDPHKAPQQYQSTVGRELAFVLSHTVHHNALIRSIAAQQGFEAPEFFGYAPSTIARLTHAR